MSPIEKQSDSVPTTTSTPPSPAVSYWTGTTEGSTFESPKLKHWTETHLEDAERILNPCAGTATLDVDGDVFRVDINPDANADLHIDFRDLPEYVSEQSFDAIVYDPPYTSHQARSKYGLELSDSEFHFYKPATKRILDSLLEPDGVFIQFGYSTHIMPSDLGYTPEHIALFNKLGGQNDYLGVTARKPPTPPTPATTPSRITTAETVKQNAGAEKIPTGNISTGGNSGQEITMQYHRPPPKTSLDEAFAATIGQWLTPADRILHVFGDTPRASLTPHSNHVTTCRYAHPNTSQTDTGAPADIVETPWNIGSRFGTGVFDAIVLDLPSEAFQRNIRTPYEIATKGSDVTHVDTALKRNITDIVDGDGGQIIQIGQTATLMSGIEYDYQRCAVSILSPPDHTHDQIIAVDAKPHENIETAGLDDGEVDGLYQHPHGAPGIEDKRNRSPYAPSSDSNFCVHCGNSFFHHPAAYRPCPECHAAGGSLCVTPNGASIHPSGSDHRITAADLHDARIEYATQYHNGRCNGKTTSELPPKRTTTSPSEKKKTSLTDYAD